VFWVGLAIEYTGRYRPHSFIYRNGGGLIPLSFIFFLVLANATPLYITTNLENAGYYVCKDPSVISDTGRGRTYIFQLNPCQPKKH
jgi:hypothetical protein